jgi:hypothetical protein
MDICWLQFFELFQRRKAQVTFFSCVHFMHYTTISLRLFSLLLRLIYSFLSFCFYSFLLRRWSAWWRHAPFCRQTDAVTLNRHAGWGQGPGKKMLRADGEIRDAFCNMQETKRHPNWTACRLIHEHQLEMPQNGRTGSNWILNTCIFWRSAPLSL